MNTKTTDRSISETRLRALMAMADRPPHVMHVMRGVDLGTALLEKQDVRIRVIDAYSIKDLVA